MTEEKARTAAEALASALGISFFVVKSEDGAFSAVQLPPHESEIIAAVEPPSRRLPDDTPGFGTRCED